MSEEKDGVVFETLQEQRERERELLIPELLTPKGAKAGLELKELLALIAIGGVVIAVTLAVIV